MATAITGFLGEREFSKWLAVALGATALLYMVGYVDGSVHAAAVGLGGAKLGYVHEFFHHARHVALMCH
jgi:hypothetical protein